MSVPAVIKSVEIKNFGPHEDTYVEFTANEVAIRGPNNAGKSQLVKAMQTALLNENLPAERIRYGETHCSITVEHVNGRRIRRSRKGAKQRIELFLPDGSLFAESDGPKGFDEKVAEFMGFRKTVLDKNDSPYNFHFIPLGAPPFLLGLGPEKVLRALSTVLTGKGVETAKINLSKALKPLKEELMAETKTLANVQERISYLNEPKWATWKEKFQKIEKKNIELTESENLIEFMTNALEQFERTPLNEDDRIQLQLISSEALPELEINILLLSGVEQTLTFLRTANTEQKRFANERTMLVETVDILKTELAEIDAQLDEFVCEKCHRRVQVLF